MNQIEIKYKIPMYSVFLSILILISAEYNNLFLSIIITMIALYGVKKPEKIIPTFFLASLSSDYFVAFEGMGFARIFSIILLLGFLLSNRSIILRKKWLLELSFIFSATILTYLFSNYKEINSLLSMVLNITVFIIFTNYRFDEKEILKLLNGIFASVVIMILFISMQFLISPHFLDNGRLTIGDSINENRFAMMLAQLAAFSMGYIFLIKKRTNKMISLTLPIICVYFILLSGSRSAFVGVLFGMIFTIILFAHKKERQKKLILILLTFGLIVYFALEYIISLNPLLAYRFNIQHVLASGGTRRWPRIITELKYVIPNNALFGVGLTGINEYIATSKYMSDPGSSHNFIVSMLAQIGIVGFIAYNSFFYKIIRQLIKSLRVHTYPIISLMLILTAIFNGVGEVIYSERLFWSALSLAGVSLSIKKVYMNI